MAKLPPDVLLGNFSLAIKAYPHAFLNQLANRCLSWSDDKRDQLAAVINLGVSRGGLDPMMAMSAGALENSGGGGRYTPLAADMKTTLKAASREANLQLMMGVIVGIYNDAAVTIVASIANKVKSGSGYALKAILWFGEKAVASKEADEVKALQDRFWWGHCTEAGHAYGCALEFEKQLGSNAY